MGALSTRTQNGYVACSSKIGITAGLPHTNLTYSDILQSAYSLVRSFDRLSHSFDHKPQDFFFQLVDGNEKSSSTTRAISMAWSYASPPARFGRLRGSGV